MIPIKIRDTEIWVEYKIDFRGQVEVLDIEIGDFNVFELIHPTSLLDEIEDKCMSDYIYRCV